MYIINSIVIILSFLFFKYIIKEKAKNYYINGKSSFFNDSI
jgi:hypothetical protein